MFESTFSPTFVQIQKKNLVIKSVVVMELGARYFNFNGNSLRVSFKVLHSYKCRLVIRCFTSGFPLSTNFTSSNCNPK